MPTVALLFFVLISHGSCSAQLFNIGNDWLEDYQAGFDHLNVTIKTNAVGATRYRLQFRNPTTTMWKNVSDYATTLNRVVFKLTDLKLNVSYQLRPIALNNLGQEGEAGTIETISTIPLLYESSWYSSHDATYRSIQVTVLKSVKFATSYQLEGSLKNDSSTFINCKGTTKLPGCAIISETAFNSTHIVYTLMNLLPDRQYIVHAVPYYRGKRGTPTAEKILLTKSIDELQCLDVTDTTTNVWIHVNTSHTQRRLSMRMPKKEWEIFEGFHNDSINSYIVYVIEGLESATKYEFQYQCWLNGGKYNSRIVSVTTKEPNISVVHGKVVSLVTLAIVIIVVFVCCLSLILSVACLRRHKKAAKT